MRVEPLRIGRDEVATKWNNRGRVTVHLEQLNASLHRIRGCDLQVSAPRYWRSEYSELGEVLHSLLVLVECPLSRRISALRDQFAECTVREGQPGELVVQWRKRRTTVDVEPCASGGIPLEGQQAVFDVLHALARQLAPADGAWLQLVDAASQCLVPTRHAKRKSRVLTEVLIG